MRKIIVILILGLFFSFSVNAQTKNDFCKKWYLKGYVYWGFTFSQDDNEKNDYLNFSSDGKYSAINEGKYETGTWTWKSSDKKLYLVDSKNNKSTLQVEKITTNELIVIAEEDGDSITIKFSTEK